VARRTILSQHTLIVVGVGLLSLGISLWQLSVPELQSLYNSGVYFGSSYKFVTGVMPYREFVFVQPPGIVLLLSPVTLLSRLVGTHDGYIVARIVSGVVCAANASMLALLVRHRGRAAMIIAGVGLALLPVSFLDTSSVMLEPYCIMFVLAGALLVFHDGADRSHSTRILTLAGVLFGAALLVKLWALLPLLAFTLVLLPRYRARFLAFIGGVVGTFAAFSLPFLVASPRAFVSQVVGAQVSRGSNPTNDLSITKRIINLTGLATTRVITSGGDAIALFTVLAAMVAFTFYRRKSHQSVDTFLLASALLSVAALLLSHEFYSYYAYFSAPFLLGLLAVSVVEVVSPVARRAMTIKVRESVRALVRVVAIAVAPLLLLGLILWVTTQYTTFDWAYGTYAPWVEIESKYVPVGSCVLYSDVAYGILSNRLTTTDPHCPDVVDPDGIWLATHVQWGKPTTKFANQWRGYFERSQYAVILYPHVARIPWNTSLSSWFESHYHLVYGRHYLYVYKNNNAPKS
jgi:hypothetical protein